MLAWSFLEDQIGYGSTEIIRLYEIRDSNPNVNFSISEVNHFLADIKKLLFAGLLDENIVEAMFKSSLYPWGKSEKPTSFGVM